MVDVPKLAERVELTITLYARSRATADAFAREVCDHALRAEMDFPLGSIEYVSVVDRAGNRILGEIKRHLSIDQERAELERPE